MPSVPVRLWPGDRWGEVAVFADLPGETIVEADKTAAIALLDRAAFLALVAEFPIAWLAVAEHLSRELKTTSDLLREIQEVEASEARHASLSRFLDMKRRLPAPLLSPPRHARVVARTAPRPARADGPLRLTAPRRDQSALSANVVASCFWKGALKTASQQVPVAWFTSCARRRTRAAQIDHPRRIALHLRANR